LAAYALWLRIDQYGLTPDRVFATAYLVVAAGFTVGYAFAALRKGPWMKPLEPTNLIMAAVSVLLLIALFTPIADPARLSVGSQVKRLESGKVSAAKFDYAFLRFDSSRYGREVLDRLKADSNPEIAMRAGEALEPDYNRPPRVSKAPKKPDLSKITVYPTDARLPDDFANQNWGDDSGSICLTSGSLCSALLLDVDGDGAAEVLLAVGRDFDVFTKAEGRWRKTAEASTPCWNTGLQEALKAGTFRMSEPAPRRDLLVGDRAFILRPAETTCPPQPPSEEGLR
jgi:hypothetical protein